MSDEPLEIARARQLFGFLKAFAEQRVPTERVVNRHPWTLWFRDLEPHPYIEIGEVLLATASEGGEEDETGDDSPLLRVRKPKLTPPPAPPPDVRDFLKPGWEDPEREAEPLSSRNIIRDGETITEWFNEDGDRVARFQHWATKRDQWAQAERAPRRVMAIYSKLFELHQQIGLRSEQVELVLGDGRLRWIRKEGLTDHPVLLQRVELLFNSDEGEFVVMDADRPPELYGALLVGDDGVIPDDLHRVRTILAEGGFHPLAGEPTSRFLKVVASLLGPTAEFVDLDQVIPETGSPVISRDPILFLRSRALGFSAAFDKILVDLEHRTTLPPAITRTVGVDGGGVAVQTREAVGAWSEPPDVLLSKPANEQQIQIARVLEQKGTVLVQGPPGTGKSHTIANLIGHLVAQGKRVLVTSHTTKALKVLRDHVVETLRPLCVAVLENDLQGRAQLEESINGILTRLSTSDDVALARAAGKFAEQRGALIAEIDGTVRKLQNVREAEYQPIVVGGEPIEPAKAAEFVRQHATEHGWIPGEVESGAPLPLTATELEELYASNDLVTLEEERELAIGLPDWDCVLQPSAFAEAVAEAEGSRAAGFEADWQHPAREDDIGRLGGLNRDLVQLVADLDGMAPWQLALISEGYTGTSGLAVWTELGRIVADARNQFDQSRALLLRHPVERLPAEDREGISQCAREIADHLTRGKRLGWFTLLLRPRWKALIRGCRVNGREPSGPDDFRAIHAETTLAGIRERLRLRWQRQAEPAGFPEFDRIAPPQEPALDSFAGQFEGLLTWWTTRWGPLEAGLTGLGYRYGAVQARALASSPHDAPFDRDTEMIRSQVRAAVTSHHVEARAIRSRRFLAENLSYLETLTGSTSQALRDAAASGDTGEYLTLWQTLRALADKAQHYHRREAALSRLFQAAPGWAGAIRRREGVHGTGRLPGGPEAAWRWAQLQSELVRRRELNEGELQHRLLDRHSRLRQTTAELIDRRAWLEQLRRVGLKAQMALHGWALTRRRIGKGTGKRVPALQAQARRQLAEAQDAVPVWIMPLARVAEAIDPGTSRFDVVIIDESSQCDVTGLLAWYLADKVIVVGDDKQVSPLAVGQEVAVAQSLISQYLVDIPNRDQYDGKLSLYDLAQQSFGGTIRLREHFRCMPDIIEFSNELSYDFEIEPLRNPYAVPRPHVVGECVSGAVRKGKINLQEARQVAALVAAMDSIAAYEGKSIGAISLLADEQAALIRQLTGQLVDAARLEERHFLAGNSAQFQGDERDVMFLSMVDSPGAGPLPMRQEDYLKQRYNVAVSRAKDQLWVVHSLDPGRDLKEGDLRKRLLEYVRSPGARGKAFERAKPRTESQFEVEVLRRLIAAGYSVTPQVKVGSYRIDLVVRGGGKQVAIECDGARWHPVEQIPDDLRRQAILERCGWTFIRIRSTTFYANPDETMAAVFTDLKAFGVTPAPAASDIPPAADSPLIQEVRARAWEIMKAQGWLDEQIGAVVDEGSDEGEDDEVDSAAPAV